MRPLDPAARPSFLLRPFTLPEALRTYGVVRVYPAQPGDVAMAMYAPAVATTPVPTPPTGNISRLPTPGLGCDGCLYAYAT